MSFQQKLTLGARQEASRYSQPCLCQHLRSIPSTLPSPCVRHAFDASGSHRVVPKTPRRVRAASTGDDELHETKLGPNVTAGIKEVKEGLTWSQATVTRNEALNLDGSHRLLHLSVSDQVDRLYGRKISGVQKTYRWIDSYTIPGQFVALRLPGSEPGAPDAAPCLHVIANSPYQSRRDSAYIGASIVEVVVDRNEGGDDASLSELKPGDTVEVSNVVGRGFSSLFNSYVGLQSVLEEGRTLLLIAVGPRGLAAARAALNWAPLQAHATQHSVTCYYVTDSPSSAGCLPEWDQWREYGVNFMPLYTDAAGGTSNGSSGDKSAGSSSSSGGGGDQAPSNGLAGNGGAAAASGGYADEADRVVGGGGGGAGARVGADVLARLDQVLFLRERGLQGALGGRPADAAVLVAGVSGSVASGLAKELTFKGVAWERLLFCEYF